MVMALRQYQAHFSTAQTSEDILVEYPFAPNGDIIAYIPPAFGEKIDKRLADRAFHDIFPDRIVAGLAFGSR